MGSDAIKATTDQKDWDDFFAAGYDFKTAVDPLDSYAERVRLACELSGKQIKKTNQRLDEPKKKTYSPPLEFEFDR